jgi:hypothetical protein
MHTRKAKIETGKCITKSIKFLKKLANSQKNSNKIRDLVGKATNEELLSLVEISLNLLQSRIPLVARTKLKRLANQADLIRRLSRSRTASSARHLLANQQSGRGIPQIAGLLASTFLPIIIEKLMKK